MPEQCDRWARPEPRVERPESDSETVRALFVCLILEVRRPAGPLLKLILELLRPAGPLLSSPPSTTTLGLLILEVLRLSKALLKFDSET